LGFPVFFCSRCGHSAFSFCGDYRGHDMNHSASTEKQGKSGPKRKRRMAMESEVVPDDRGWPRMKGHGAKFGRKMEEAIVALLTHRNIEEAANAVGVSVKTLLRWQKLPEFAAAYREARRAVVSQANARLQQATGAASAAVLRLMVDAHAPAAVRLRAAECVLDHAAKAIEIEDIEVRVSELERAAERSRWIWKREWDG
jgi:hypothetical protein